MRKNIRVNGKRMLAAAAVAATVSGLWGCQAAQVPGTVQVQNLDSDSNQISVTGIEEVQTVPDMAEIVFAVRTQEATAQACQEKNAENLNAAIEVLRGLGIQDESMQTSSYGMSPIYNWDSDTQEITGYEMNTQLTVSDIPIDQAGEILSQAVAAGVNTIENVSYFCSNYDESYQEALQQAIAMAQAKAQAMAQAGGRTLGQVISIEESGYNPSARYSSSVMKNAVTAEAAADGGTSMSVMAGQVSIEARVNVKFALE